MELIHNISAFLANTPYPSSTYSGDINDDKEIIIVGHKKCVENAKKMWTSKLKSMMNVENTVISVDPEVTQKDSLVQMIKTAEIQAAAQAEAQRNLFRKIIKTDEKIPARMMWCLQIISAG